MSNLSVNNSSPSFTSQNSLSASNNFSTSPTISLENKNIVVADPVYNTVNKNTLKYTVSNASKYTDIPLTINNTNYTVQSKRNNIISNQNNTGGSTGGGIVNAGTAIVGKTTEDNNSNPQINRFIALNNIDLSIFNDYSSKQGVGYTPGSGATDPGEDPTEEPIPVPDGFWVMLMMAAGYTAMKFFKKKPQTV
jgi:hypothetical protein